MTIPIAECSLFVTGFIRPDGSRPMTGKLLSHDRTRTDLLSLRSALTRGDLPGCNSLPVLVLAAYLAAPGNSFTLSSYDSLCSSFLSVVEHGGVCRVWFITLSRWDLLYYTCWEPSWLVSREC